MSVLKRKNELGQWEAIQQVTSNASTLGEKPPEQYLQPQNLLDNSDFTNPVNQRGQTIYNASSEYWIDRWVQTRCEIDLTARTASVADGTLNDGYFYQRVAGIKEGAILTFAVKIGDDVFVCSGSPLTGGETVTSVPFLCTTSWGGLKIIKSDNYDMILVYINAGNTIALPEWLALYEGEYTAETLPPYMPKGYGVELAECQRYYENSWFPYSKTVQYQFMGFSAISTGLDAYFDFKTIKRIIPTITLYPAGGASGWKYYTGSWNESATLPAIYTRCAASGFMTRLSVSSVTTKAVYCQEGHWEASADL